MHITIVADAIHPFADKTSLSEETSILAKAFRRTGHEVSCIAPFNAIIDVAASSLARRLTPVKVEDGGRSASCARYDGRTPEGVSLYFVDGDLLGENPSSDLFAAAALAVMASLLAPPDACILIGPRSLAAASAAKRRGSDKRAVPMIARLSSGSIGDTSSTRAASDADRLVLSSNRLVSMLIGELDFLDGKLADGSAVAISKPASVCLRDIDKESSKTRFQIKAKLPVRNDVPLVLASDISMDSLREALTHDLQIAVADKHGSLAELKKSYADRLALIGDDDFDDALIAADAVLVGKNLDLCHAALASGAIPVVDPELAADAVELEPSLESGSAIVAGQDGPRLKAGLGRLLGAYKKKDAFRKLSIRLPSFAPSSKQVVAKYIQLIEELK